ncbi:MAG: hypothetical protein OXB93_04780 [Cytophagales bacterium]|nr:hypothetical protein [Cytophagales bacterium]
MKLLGYFFLTTFPIFLWAQTPEEETLRRILSKDPTLLERSLLDKENLDPRRADLLSKEKEEYQNDTYYPEEKKDKSEVQENFSQVEEKKDDDYGKGYYGYSFFGEEEQWLEANQNFSPPEGYRLGNGDEIIIDI